MFSIKSSGDICPPFFVTITGDKEICIGDSTTLTAVAIETTGTVLYSWSTGASTDAITVAPLSLTNYSVTVTDDSGSVVKSIKVEVLPMPVASFTYSSSPTVQFNNTSTDAVSYAWDFGDGQSTSAEHSRVNEVLLFRKPGKMISPVAFSIQKQPTGLLYRQTNPHHCNREAPMVSNRSRDVSSSFSEHF